MKRTLAASIGLALAATATLGLAPAAQTTPALAPLTGLAGLSGAGADVGSSEGRGAGTSPTARLGSTSRAAAVAEAAAADAADPDEALQQPTSYPVQPQLKVYPDATPADATDLNRTISYDDIAPRLNGLMRTSELISTQVVGTSTQGREIYLVTVTAPETRQQTARQSAWRDKIKDAPAAAATDADLKAGYKTPIWFSSNIHGNEWEGTDASMQVIEDLVTAPYAEVRELLTEHRLYFSVTLNPDGRTIGQRATALNLDPNRDMITSTTPESRSFVRVAQALQPLYAADLHGYTSVLQVEPCGPPHGENYEYDLFIPHGYAIARQVEDDVVAADIPGNTYYDQATGRATTAKTGKIKIPYRDTPDGWDDYPPIFTAQYAAFHGAVTATVELPKGRTGAATTPADAVINTAVAKQTIESMIDYVTANSAAMLDNQIQMFARGVAGAPKQALTVAGVAAVPGPAEWKPLWDVVDNQDPVTLPRAYVIPVGSTQRSMTDAATLVRRLLLHGVEVGTLDAATTVGGTTYPAGSWVVDLHQPLRGMANVLLDLGTDISAKVPSMYDVSAWSLSYLWGATVAKVGLTTDQPLGATTPVTEVASLAAVPAAAGPLSLEVAGVADVAALNALLEQDVPVSMLADGTAVVAADGYDEAQAVSADLGVPFTAATPADLAALTDPTTKGLEDLRVGYTGAQVSDDQLALAELGFDDLTQVTVDALATNPTLLDGVDVLFVGSPLNLTTGANAPAALRALQTAVLGGLDVVGRGSAGFAVASRLDVVSATAVAGPGGANGIVGVTTPAGSPLAPHAQDSSFVSAPLSFTTLGSGTTAAQLYRSGKALLAGHWRTAATTDAGSQQSAAGRASAIAGSNVSGARGFVFGTSPLFRTHPKGGLSQVARAIFWAGPAGAGVPGTPVPPVVTPPVVTPPVVVPPVVTPPVVVPPTTVPAPAAAAASTVRLRVERLGQRRVRLVVRLAVAGSPGSGSVVVKDRGRTLRTLRVSGGTTKVTLRLRPGAHTLRVKHPGSTTVLPSSSRRVGFRLG